MFEFLENVTTDAVSRPTAKKRVFSAPRRRDRVPEGILGRLAMPVETGQEILRHIFEIFSRVAAARF